MSHITNRRGLALAAMTFAVAMTFIDQTIVSIAAPSLQEDLGLSSTGVQWAVNAYILTTAAFFALGGRLTDALGSRRMVMIGTAVFAAASALCGLTPAGHLAEAWLIAFRALQGVGGALLYPAALAVVASAYPAHTRGRALALFFGVAGGLTALGPSVGGYLVAWTWRSIFWINVPVGVAAIALTLLAAPASTRKPSRIDVPGLLLVTTGVASSVFGFQQAAVWGWTSTGTLAAVFTGIALLVAFAVVETRVKDPLLRLQIFRDRGFLVENIVLGLAMMVFVPLFFFASVYAQVGLGESAARASLILLYFFGGFVAAAQLGGRMLDRVGGRRPVILGSVIASLGLAAWAELAPGLDAGQQVWAIVLTGVGMGLMLGQANTDALNHASADAYGAATGIIQTIRNYGAALGLALLGTLLVSSLRAHVDASLLAMGAPSSTAQQTADRVSQLSGQGAPGAIPLFIRSDIGAATHDVLLTMAALMALTALIAIRWLPRRSTLGQPLPAPTSTAVLADV